MSQWTWAMCDACWSERAGSQKPVRLKPRVRVEEICGWCGKPTNDGIYIRFPESRVPFAATAKIED